MSANAPLPPGPGVWQANSLHLVAFTASPAFGIEQNWWRDLTGSEPERSTDKRARQERDEAGPFDGIELALSISPIRIAWGAQPVVDPVNPPEGVPVIGPFLERKDWFVQLMQRWLVGAPPLKRLAFVGSLHQSVESHRAGYEMLDRYLRWVDIHPESRDFLYRINRRSPSGVGVAGLTINRLATWAVAKTIILARTFIGDTIEVSPAASFTCSVELDINTVPDSVEGNLPSDSFGPIFAELVEFGTKIATNGDTR